MTRQDAMGRDSIVIGEFVFARKNVHHEELPNVI